MKSSSPNSIKPSSKTVLRDGKTLRLNRYIADCGQGSRRKVEEFITSGRIKVNGILVKDLSQRVNPAEDKVTLDGKEIINIDKLGFKSSINGVDQAKRFQSLLS